MLSAVVVSQRVGAIKPQRAIFEVAERELGIRGAAILHVGDDWTADVVGAKGTGWRTCYLRDQAQDWPRQAVEDSAAEVRPDLVLADLRDLEAALTLMPWA